MDIAKKLNFRRFSSSGGTQSKAIIAIHGWQGNRNSFYSIAKTLPLPDACWYLLEAPYTIDNDDSKRSWSREISPGVWDMESPRKLIHNFFSEHIWQHYKDKYIFVLGFSMGAMVCYEVILKMDRTLGGVFPIAGFIHKSQGTNFKIHQKQLKTPIIIGHGDEDNIVPVEKSHIIFNILKDQGANVDLEIFKGKHKINISFFKRMQTHIQNKK
ncbi:MAG: hypothetical protein HN729_04300 [Candidatus Marinimicrobia bacterium]|jgi:phospholipase/carboxylesterase|nr:hypothetical protein [Candidatus Neomarinimicrobiota bacterium]MBT3633780.1 hypothetical protein [Candidatus Neomarinimicrobiota bacterium]MBT3682572.1 hypothetical protein [Candidatus Neomarinimicrobiota bacterium]MBT3759336.1 hypothetical protein [Candidatus Neomarinimicrobiota bacterium]MBT3894656.1 hypothetical protein [Candidatus Neomarinimicrobiota bacterium]